MVSYILLKNRSLLTGRPFFPFLTGVSVHISFCRRTLAVWIRLGGFVGAYDVLQYPEIEMSAYLCLGGYELEFGIHVAMTVKRLYSRQPSHNVS